MIKDGRHLGFGFRQLEDERQLRRSAMMARLSFLRGAIAPSRP
jgi:hypothetical protein